MTLEDALKPEWEKINGRDIVVEASSAAFDSPRMAVHYAQIVREKSIHRRLATFGAEIAAEALGAPPQWSPEWTEELLARAEYGLAQVASKQIAKPEPSKSEALSNALYKVEHGLDEGVPTGFPTVDRFFGGFNIGHVTMLGARTSRGKTAFATNIAINAAKAGLQTAYFTLEMPADEMWLRAVGCEAEVDLFRVRRSGYRDDDAGRVKEAQAHLAAMPLEILYRPSMRPSDLRLECRRLARNMGGLKLAVVDYFNLMRGDRHERERWREMQEAILALKGIADELSIPLLVLSQLNRDTNENEQPSLSNLRDTGATEEHASNVLFLWQEPPPPPPRGKDAPAPPPPSIDVWGDIKVIIAKQRNGPAGMPIQMEFKKNFGAFRCK